MRLASERKFLGAVMAKIGIGVVELAMSGLSSTEPLIVKRGTLRLYVTIANQIMQLMKAGCAFGSLVLGLATEVVMGSYVPSRKEKLQVPSLLSFDVWSPS